MDGSVFMCVGGMAGFVCVCGVWGVCVGGVGLVLCYDHQEDGGVGVVVVSYLILSYLHERRQRGGEERAERAHGALFSLKEK